MKSPLILHVVSKQTKPDLETIVVFARGNVSTCALRREWSLSEKDALTLAFSSGSQLLRNYIRTHFTPSHQDTPEGVARAVVILVELVMVLQEDCSPDLGAHLKAMKDVCGWSQLSSVELSASIDHIDAHSQDTLWMCFLLSGQGCAMVTKARAKVKDAQRSEEDEVKIKLLETEVLALGLPSGEADEDIEAFMTKSFLTSLDKFMETVKGCSQATLESRTKANLVPIAEKVDDVLEKCVAIRQKASRDTVADVMEMLKDKPLLDVFHSVLGPRAEPDNPMQKKLEFIKNEVARMTVQHQSLQNFFMFMQTSPVIVMM